MAAKRFKLALIQLAVSSNKADNLQRAAQKVKEAADQGAHLVALPECFNSPYGTGYFAEYAEEIETGESSKALSQAAKDNQVYLIGGSFPERKDGKLYNTSTTWGPNGSLLAVYRKMHLFDINIPGKIKFQESETLSSGDRLSTFQLGDFCQVGLGICYDIRFAELAQLYARQATVTVKRHDSLAHETCNGIYSPGCKLLVYPGAFNMTTGPVHWELLQKCRALDNQVYVAAVSPARIESSSYVAWGHSTVVSPWGEVVSKTDHSESITYADIDLSYLDQVRQQIPLTKQRRTDVYEVVETAKAK